MTKTELIERVARDMNITKTDAKECVACVFGTIEEALTSGESVNIYQFGSFNIVDKAERNGHNPSTGEKLVIPAHKVVKFKPSQYIKDAVR